MKITLSKFITAKREFADLATEGLRPRVFSPSGGSFEDEIRGILLNGGGR